MNNKALLEAALFVADVPLSMEKLVKIVGVPEEDLNSLLAQLKQDLEKEDRGIDIVQTPEGFELRVKPEYRDGVVRLAPLADLSNGMMRTLAIIAAKQPVKQSIIVKYQGNKVYDYMAILEEKGLIRREKYGRTRLVSTTPDFEKYFGKSSDEIKKFLAEKEKEPGKEEAKGEKKEESAS